MRRIAFLVMGLMALSGPAVVNAAFVAYNDLVDIGGVLNPNVTEIGIPDGGTVYGSVITGTPGLLKDYATGVNTNVTLTVSTFEFSNVNQDGVPAFTGGAALAEFGSIVNSMDYMKEGNPRTATSGAGDKWVDLTFTGMNPGRRYTVVVTGNRGGNGIRPGLFTLSSADAFTNTSSLPGIGYTGPNDPTAIFETGVNTSNGNVARFTDIAPGVDGSVKVRVQPLLVGQVWNGITSDGRVFLNQVKLVEVPEPATLSLLALGGLMLYRRRRA